jgi:hypothetical protein
MKATSRRSLRRAWYLAASWQMPVHIALALGLGLSCGLVAQQYPSMITPHASALIGSFILYPLVITIWWRLNGAETGDDPASAFLLRADWDARRSAQRPPVPF